MKALLTSTSGVQICFNDRNTWLSGYVSFRPAFNAFEKNIPQREWEYVRWDEGETHIILVNERLCCDFGSLGWIFVLYSFVGFTSIFKINCLAE